MGLIEMKPKVNLITHKVGKKVKIRIRHPGKGKCDNPEMVIMLCCNTCAQSFVEKPKKKHKKKVATAKKQEKEPKRAKSS